MGVAALRCLAKPLEICCHIHSSLGRHTDQLQPHLELGDKEVAKLADGDDGGGEGSERGQDDYVRMPLQCQHVRAERKCKTGLTLVGSPRFGVLVLSAEDHAEGDLLRLLRAIPVRACGRGQHPPGSLELRVGAADGSTGRCGSGSGSDFG